MHSYSGSILSSRSNPQEQTDKELFPPNPTGKKSIWKIIYLEKKLETEKLKVNVGKIKVLKCEDDAKLVKESAKFFCGDWCKGTGSNLIHYIKKSGSGYMKKCSKIKGNTESIKSYHFLKLSNLPEGKHTKVIKKD